MIAACSSATGPIKQPTGSGSPVAHDAAPTASGPTERECDDLIAHVIELRLTELRPATPLERMPTEPELNQLRAELRADPGCRALPIERYRCAIAAKATTELAACHSTPSSSTSNSKVAPGGMTPPAPALP